MNGEYHGDDSTQCAYRKASNEKPGHGENIAVVAVDDLRGAECNAVERNERVDQTEHGAETGDGCPQPLAGKLCGVENGNAQRRQQFQHISLEIESAG